MFADYFANEKLVSICIPTYRRPTQLLQAIYSCVSQVYRPLEIDVGDDSPADDSEILVRSIVLPDGVSLRYRRNAPSLGQADNLNALFAAARGKQIVVLHDDDVLLPDAIAQMRALAATQPGIIAVYGRQQIIHENGEASESKTEALNLRYGRTAKHTGRQPDALVAALRRQFPNDGYMVDAERARTVGLRPFAEVGESCDTDFGIRLAMHSASDSFYFVDTLTTQYRLSISGLSGSRDISWRFYEYLLALPNRFTPEQQAARNQLLSEIAVQATVEHALRGNRRSALRIIASQHYPRQRRSGFVKLLYHLLLIAVPQLSLLRSRRRRTID